MIEARQGTLDAARKTLADAQAATSGEGGALHGGMARPSTAGDKQTVQVMIQELQAMILRAEGQRDAALELLASAAKTDDALLFEYGPPVPVKPVHELYGDILLNDAFHLLNGQLAEGESRNLDKIESDLKEAKKQYEKAMEKCPKRWLSSVGVSRAEEELGLVQSIRGGH
jgi:tetratricopeptide (TPR) repeat protein